MPLSKPTARLSVAPSSGSGGGGVELITITQSGETFIANKNSEEIISLIDSGKLPMLIVPPEALAKYNIHTKVYMFPMVQDGTEIEMPGFVFGTQGLGFATVDNACVVTIMIGG